VAGNDLTLAAQSHATRSEAASHGESAVTYATNAINAGGSLVLQAGHDLSSDDPSQDLNDRSIKGHRFVSKADNQVNEALVIYVGYGMKRFPKEDAARLLLYFNEEKSAQLMSEIRSILNDLNQLRPDWTALSLGAAEIWARHEMAERYPQLNDGSLKALGWVFTWWWR
jgi:hypothetical protein